jgi:hypothetical protein
MLRTAVAFIVGLAVGAIALSSTPSQAQVAAPRTVQLRLYTIDKGRLDDFARAWHAGVYPLRRQLGYQIPFAAKIPSTNQFIWLLSYDGPEPWDQKEAAYYGSAQRKQILPDPAQWIARPEQWMLTPVVDLPRQ